MNQCSAVLFSVLCLLLFTGATNTNTAISIVQRNLTVKDGQEAQFMCEVPCTHEVFWYVADFHNSFALPYTDSLADVTYSRSYSACNTAGRYNDTLTLTATTTLNNAPIQCSASMIDCNSGDESCSNIVYSRFRILRVESEAPSPTPTPSPTPSSPSPPEEETSTPCPVPSSPVVVTKTEISVSTTVTRETVTSVITVTKTPQPSDCPDVSDMRSDAQKSILSLSRLRISVTSLLLCLSVLAML